MMHSFSGSAVNVVVTLEREDEVVGPVVAPLFPQVKLRLAYLLSVISNLTSFVAETGRRMVGGNRRPQEQPPFVDQAPHASAEG
jgi:hypothetical protein